MTEKELQELKEKRDKLEQQRRNIDEDARLLNNEIEEFERQIKAEETRKKTESKMNEYVNLIRNKMEKYDSWKTCTHSRYEQIWIAEINGKKIKSGKGKHTWTSKTWAYNAACNFISEMLDKCLWPQDTRGIKVSSIVDRLIEEGYIVIKQIL